MNVSRTTLVGVCAVVIGVYAYTAPLGRLESLVSNPADAYYNLLVRGFRDGHLNLKKEVPAGFAHLAYPYDPNANRRYRGMPYGMSDLSYYKGRLYFYFGVTPALIAFWPFVALTGHYLSDRLAVMIFCAIGFLASVGLLRALWRRYCVEVSVWVVAACALALGLATGVPVLLPPSDIYQVAISCGYMLTMLALGAIWCALHEPERRCRWLAVASLAYGLAVGSRPNLLSGAIMLLVPVAHASRERRPIWAALMAATVPIMLIGLGLMLYNALRFDNPFEFGARYQLAGEWHAKLQFLSWEYVWFNFRVYFLELARWSARFPFVHGITVPPLPSGYTKAQDPFGVLTNIPLVWLALAAPLAWRDREGQQVAALRWFVIAVAMLLGMCVVLLLFYCGADIRYEVDFLPAMVLVAVIGIFGLERVLADRPFHRRLVRWGWSILLGFSVVFNLLVSVKDYAYAACSVGTMLAVNGHAPEAIRVFENALRIEPDYAEGHENLGIALRKAGRRPQAIREYEHALRLEPDYADAHVDIGIALVELGRPEDAIRHYEEALRLRPDSVEAHVDFGNALLAEGKGSEAMVHYEEALRINPDYADAHVDIGAALVELGRPEDAIRHYEEALRLGPDSVEAHVNFGNALLTEGKGPEAMVHYEEALRINPDYPQAHVNFGIALAQAGRTREAMEHWEEALRIRPDDAMTHYNLANALEGQGRVTEALEHYQQALKLQPDFAPAKNALARLQAGR